MTNASANVGKSITMLPTSTTAIFSGQKNVASVELPQMERRPSSTSSMPGSLDCSTLRQDQRTVTQNFERMTANK